VELTGDINDMIECLEFVTAFEEEFKAFILDIDQTLLIKTREGGEQEGFHAVATPGLEPFIGDDEAALSEDDIPTPAVEGEGVDQGSVAVEEQSTSALGRHEIDGDLAET
jgi:hypothetical protein